jgi:hypothetical protein
MGSELWQQVSERCSRRCGVDCFHGQDDNEYLFIVKASCGVLHVHLAQSSDGKSMAIQITVPRFFPIAARPRLSRLARRWNRRGAPFRAVLQSSIDPTRIGVVVECLVPVDHATSPDALTDAVEIAVGQAAEFFDELAAVLGPHARSRRVWLPEAS